MIEPWSATARINFQRDDETEVHILKFVVTHDEHYSDACPLCAFSRGHLVRLFEFLDDSWFVAKDSPSPNPAKTIWCMTGEMTDDEFVSVLIGNFSDTMKAAHVETISFRDANKNGHASIYDVQQDKFIQ